MSAEGGYRQLLEAMDTGTYSKIIFDPVKGDILNCLLRMGVVSSRDISKKSFVERVSMLNAIEKKKIIKFLEKKYKFSYPNASYSPTLIEVEGYDVKPINVPSQMLNNGRPTEFEIDIPYNVNYNFVGSQFIKCVFSEPQLADPTQVPRNYVAKFDYCPKPGIRLIRRIQAMSDIAEFDAYEQDDVLKFENDSLPDNIYKLWNDLIGQDLGIESVVYNPSTESNEVHTVKIGYQTPKEQPGKLVVYIPLLFAHNRNLNDKLNLAIFNKNTLSIKGLFNNSEYIVRATAFSTNSLTDPPVPLAVSPLKFESCELYSLMSAVDDTMYAMNLGLFYNKLYDYTKHERYEITESKHENLSIRGQGEVLQMAIMCRPVSYAADFEKWVEFTPVNDACYPVPIAVDDPANPGFMKVAIAGAKARVPVRPFKYINLMNNGVPMLVDGTKDGSGDPAIWEIIDTFSKSYRYLDYQVRKTGMIYFNFNPHVNTKRIAALYNMSKLLYSYLKYATSDAIPTNRNGSLVNPYELLVFRSILNDHIMSGDSIVKTAIN